MFASVAVSVVPKKANQGLQLARTDASRLSTIRMKKVMSRLSNIYDRWGGKYLTRLLALLLALAVPAPVLLAGDSNHDQTFPRVGMLWEFKKKSLVGSWLETVNFLDGVMKGRVLTSLVSFHDDGTVVSSDQGSVTTDPPPATVTSDGIGAWRQLDWHRFAYTELSLFSDFSGNLTNFLKVRGTYTLSDSGDKYSGTSYYEVLATDRATVLASGFVSNEGERIRVEQEPTPTPDAAALTPRLFESDGQRMDAMSRHHNLSQTVNTSGVGSDVATVIKKAINQSHDDLSKRMKATEREGGQSSEQRQKGRGFRKSGVLELSYFLKRIPGHGRGCVMTRQTA
jgi:hypothetical protein